MSDNNGTALVTSGNRAEGVVSAGGFGEGPEWLRGQMEDTAPMDAVDRPNAQVPAPTGDRPEPEADPTPPPTVQPGLAADPARWSPWRRRSEADRLEAELAEAARLVPIQSDPLLAERMSPRERAAQARSARKIRNAQRKAHEATELAQVRRAVRSQTVTIELENRRAADERWRQRAESDRERLASPAVRMGRLARSIRYRRMVYLAVAYVGIVWGAFNVHDIVVARFAIDRTDGLYWLSYGLEPLLTVPLVQMMRDRATLAEWGRALSWRRNWPIYLVEAALLLATMSIATLPRLGDGKVALLYLVAPVMIAVSMILLPNGAHQLGEILTEARDDAAEAAALGDSEAPLGRFVARLDSVFAANEAGEIGGVRDELGVPSATQIAAHQGIRKSTAATIRRIWTRARTSQVQQAS